ncbi:lipase family protein [Cryptosporangium minutisporangium]|uniref:Lipase family protein n=1 Tax=Cryptosporangium minutisporangium TaxID=113569 RepID=A0ABP6T1A0_9ACTN
MTSIFRTRRGAGTLVATVALVLATLVAPAFRASPAAAAPPPTGPSGDAFYTPPSPLPAGADGDVIWWRQLPDDLINKGYLVLYGSRSALGTPIAVSGRVLVPKLAWRGPGTRPIVSVASGTRGIGDSCAPSKFQPDYEKPLFIDAMLRRGWAVAITDYEGLGTPGTHPYIVGRSEGHGVIDVVRAATRLPATGLRAGGPVGFAGYSQGGGGAAWAGELAPTYAPELNVVGITAGGTPADLDVVATSLDGTLGFGFALLAALGLDAAYPELNLPAFLNEKGKQLYATQQGACVDAVFGYAFQRIADYTTTNPLATPQWRARLAENELGSAPPKAPVYLFHGTHDEIIPLSQAQTLRRQYCAAGVKVRWATFVGEHVTTLVASAPDVLKFLTDRFAGRPAPNNC